MLDSIRLFAMLCAVACCACTTTSTHTGSSSVPLDSSYDTAFYAVLDVFNAHDLSPETVDYEAGHITTARGHARMDYARYRVVQAKAYLDSTSADAVQLRLLLTFQGQADEQPRSVPRTERDSRAWEYTREGLGRSNRAARAYGYYVEAIRERIRELNH